MLIAALLGVALVASSGRSYCDAQRAVAAVAEREGIGFLVTLTGGLARGDFRSADMAATLEANRSLGLTYLAVAIDGNVEVEAGRSLLAQAAAFVGAPAFGQGRVRMVGFGGPDSGAFHFAPSDGRAIPVVRGGLSFEGPPLFPRAIAVDGLSLSRRGAALPHHPYLVIEFEPISAQDILRRAIWVFVLSCGVAVLLTAAAVVLWRRARSADRIELELSAQRYLAQLGEMSAVLAHEIQNPLASLKGHAQLLLEEVTDSALASRVERVVRESVRLDELTNDLLDFARTGAIDVVVASPSEVLGRAALATEPERVELACESAPLQAAFDPRRIEQVLINLLENALAATPRPLKVRAQASVSGGGLLFAIRDRGAGVPLADRARIFEPFHTTKLHGTGLGLAISKKLVELHGGRLEVVDAVGGGALFHVFIPKSHAV